MRKLLIAFLGSLFLAEPGMALPEPAYAKLNEVTIEQHVLPRYQAFARASSALHSESETFCKAPDAAALPRLQQAYRDAAGAWQDIQHVRFGPVDLFFRSQRIAFWPDPRNTIAKQMGDLLAKRDAAAIQPERLGKGSVAVQGLPVLERLFFGEDAAKLTRDDAEAAFRCRYATAVAVNLDGIARETAEEWTRVPPDGRDMSLNLFKSLYMAVELIADHKLARPLGASAAQARPRAAESWRSETSLANIRRNLVAALELYRVAFSPVLPQGELNTAILRGFGRSIAAADAIKPSLEAAVENASSRPSVEALATEVLALKALLVQQLPPALDLPLGFNALDGD